MGKRAPGEDRECEENSEWKWGQRVPGSKNVWGEDKGKDNGRKRSQSGDKESAGTEVADNNDSGSDEGDMPCYPI